MKKSYTGGCLCGKIKFKIKDAETSRVVFCHCTQCRRNYGLYGAFVNVPKANIKITGERNISWFKSSTKAKRGFCKNCGSPIFWEYLGSSETSIMPGLFDNIKLKNGLHLFVGEKGGYYEIHDHFPQYKTYPK